MKTGVVWTKTTREEKRRRKKKKRKQKKHTFYLRFISLRNDPGSAFLLEFRGLEPRTPVIHNPASSIHTEEGRLRRFIIVVISLVPIVTSISKDVAICQNAVYSPRFLSLRVHVESYGRVSNRIDSRIDGVTRL